MAKTTRRRFLAGTTAGLAAVSSFTAISSSQAVAPSERFRVGIIGSGSQGKAHQIFGSSLSDLEIVYVCDVDQERLDAGAARTGAKPVADFRRILDDASIVLSLKTLKVPAGGCAFAVGCSCSFAAAVMFSLAASRPGWTCALPPALLPRTRSRSPRAAPTSCPSRRAERCFSVSSARCGG